MPLVKVLVLKSCAGGKGVGGLYFCVLTLLPVGGVYWIVPLYCYLPVELPPPFKAVFFCSEARSLPKVSLNLFTAPRSVLWFFWMILSIELSSLLSSYLAL